MDIYPNLNSNNLESHQFEQQITETIRNKEVIAETIDWFNKMIESTKEIDRIWADINTSAEDIKVQILAKKQLREMLMEKRDIFISDMEIAKDNKEKGNA